MGKQEVDVAQTVLAGLTQAGWWRVESDVPVRCDGPELLAAALASWRAASDAGSQRAGVNPRGVLAFLQRAASAGAKLTLGIPAAPAKWMDDWLGPVVAWWPRGIPGGAWTGIISSRLGNSTRQTGAWAACLRAALGFAKCSDRLVAFAERGVAGRFLAEYERLLALPTLRIRAAKPGCAEEFGQWLRARARGFRPHEPGGAPRFEVHLFPLRLDATSTSRSGSGSPSPYEEHALCGLSQRLLVTHLRQGGKVEQMLRRRTEELPWPRASIICCLTPADRRGSSTLHHGAHRATFPQPDSCLAYSQLMVRDVPPCRVDFPPPGSPTRRTMPRLQQLPPPEAWTFLTHCTRAPVGRWPGESPDEYFRDLLRGASRAPRTSRATLLRILQEGRIRASGAAIRGGYRVVCFTELPPHELVRMRAYRRHRRRWDFEPYGICIAREWLAGYGARAVLYGDEPTWRGLPPEDRPFFQKGATRSTDSGESIDWRVEREWRLIGDLDLNLLDNASALILVPSLADAAAVAPYSRWPIALVPASDNQLSRFGGSLGER